jgi:Holliday junction resolvase RusA-like endonuclease
MMALRARTAKAGGRKGGTVKGSQTAAVPPAFFWLPMPPSTNRLTFNRAGRGRTKTEHYDRFIAESLVAIVGQKVHHIPGRVVALIAVERMHATADIDNRIKAIFDAIVKAGVIEDDRMITAFAATWTPKAEGLAWISLFQCRHVKTEFHPTPDGLGGAWIIQQQAQEDRNEEHGNFS